MSNQIEEQAELRAKLSIRVEHDEEGRYGERCDGEYECVCDDDFQPYEVLSDLTLDSLLEVFNEELSKQKENWEKEKERAVGQAEYLVASSVLTEMAPLMVHRREKGFPEMTGEVIGEVYNLVKKTLNKNDTYMRIAHLSSNKPNPKERE